MAAPPDTSTQTPLTRLFDRELAGGVAVAFSLPGGVPLFMAGEPADRLFLLRAGRLVVRRRDSAGETRELGVIRPGEPAGEMALMAGEAHAATALALRDCELLALPRDAFLRAAAADAAVMADLARLIVRRTRDLSDDEGLGEPSVYAFFGVAASVDARSLAEAVAAAITDEGLAATVVGVEAQAESTEWFSHIERAHDFVFYAAEFGEEAWKALVARQADRLFWVGAGGASPPTELDTHAGAALRDEELIDLILLQAPDCVAPTGSAAWRRAYAPARLFQIRPSNRADIARMARVITGRAVGLVLSGGAARAYAHVGAVRALRRRGVPIDFVCGVSMGAVIAAGVAIGWDDEELDRRIRRAFVESSPVGDIAFPLVALTRGGLVRARLREHFGDRQICDFWLPFFCLSTNLTRGTPHVHRHGLAREALRASLALPGLLPPVVKDLNIFVDGAVMNNFPADVLRRTHPGPIVGVDVGLARSIDARDLMDPVSVWRWLVSGAWKRGPPIVSLLIRAATVTTGRDAAAARDATDVLVQPEVDSIEIRDWRAYAPAVAAGESAMLAALDRLAAPVTELRQKRRAERGGADPRPSA